ncbi:MAG TPA: AAA family ATPase [Oscillospiraceae bacterium]|nr:AAA family ATPase [Oscillospiraceae bacterium]
MAESLDFFAAANSSEGFYSLYPELYGLDEVPHVMLIWGGPGTGKSTLCKKIAEKLSIHGLDCELIHCSSDPDSLDGLICSRKNAIILDATPPHIVKPKAAGIIENIINIGQFWDREKLRSNSAAITKLFSEISAEYTLVYRDIASAGDFSAVKQKYGVKMLDIRKIRKFANRFCSKFIPISEGRGRRKDRFLSGVTPKGLMFYSDTVATLCDKLFLVEDDAGTAAEVLISQIGERTLENGHDCYFCRCPMRPEHTEHLLIPDLKIAVLTKNAFHGKTLYGKEIEAEKF